MYTKMMVISHFVNTKSCFLNEKMFAFVKVKIKTAEIYPKNGNLPKWREKP
jgi:hypothetical protein